MRSVRLDPERWSIGLCAAAIVGLGFCRMALNASFWLGLLSHTDDGAPLIFLMIGGCFALVEMVGLVIYGLLRAHPKLATGWLLLWLLVAGINLYADMSGISDQLHKNTEARALVLNSYDAAKEAARAGLESQKHYADTLAQDGLNLPVTTLEAKRRALTNLIALREDNRPSYRQQIEIGRLEAALETAKARDQAALKRRNALKALELHGAPPEPIAPSFGEFAELLALAGLQVSAVGVHAAFVFVLALAIQACVIFIPKALLAGAARSGALHVSKQGSHLMPLSPNSTGNQMTDPSAIGLAPDIPQAAEPVQATKLTRSQSDARLIGADEIQMMLGVRSR